MQIVGRDGDWIQILTPRRQYGWVYGAYLTGFDDIKKRRSSNDRIQSRPAIPQGVRNSGDQLQTNPSYPVGTSTEGTDTSTPAENTIQGDDFQSGFEGAAQ